MQIKLIERRKKMLKMFFRGIATSTWVAEIAKEYECSESRIWDDWRLRKTWLDEVFDISAVVDDIKMDIAELSNIKEEAWRTYHQAENAQSKVAALKIIDGVIRNKIDILQSVGLLHKEALKVGSSIELKGGLSDEDRELLKQYVDVLEGVAGTRISADSSSKPLDPAQTH
jgi:hypothetical protein